MAPQSDHFRDWLRVSGNSPALIADPIVQSLIAVLLLSLLFLGFPGIDPWVSGLFYDPGTGFPMERLAAFRALRTGADWAIKGFVLFLLLAALLKIARPGRPAPVPPGHVAWLLSALVLGPGLLVNGILKENWGRPRPDDVYIFGGDGPFVPAWRMTDHCSGNCSFVSGEASAAIWLVGAALLLPPRWRPRARIALFVFALLVSLNRIAFGRHFLSDVLMAWALTLAVMAVLYRLFVISPPAWLANDKLEEALGNIGTRLRVLAGRSGSDGSGRIPADRP